MNSTVNHKEFVAKGLSLVHAGLLIVVGVAATWSDTAILLLWAVMLVGTLYCFLKNRADWIWYCIAASPALEVWARMTKAPLLPYEIGKYYLFIAIASLLALKLRRSDARSYHSAGYWIIGAVVPGIFVNLVVFDLDQWIFNLLGILELAVLLILASSERWSLERFCRTLQCALMPIVPVVAYLMLSASDFSKITFELKANSAASGGFGSNQVSTILGAAIVLLLVLQVLKRPLFSFRMLDFALVGLLIFRGFLTFSRGGMVVAAVAALIVLSPGIFASARSFVRSGLIALVFVFMAFMAFQKVDDLTGNMLLMRYKGESYKTLAGTDVKSFNTILSGRSDIAGSDLLIFKDNFVFGVGPGVSKTLRYRYGYKNVAAHTEFTRLLSEHGIGGLFIVVVLLVFPVWWLSKQKITAWKGVIAGLFALAIFTTFHAAMRTNTSIVMYALASIPVFYYANRKFDNRKEDTIPGQ